MLRKVRRRIYGGHCSQQVWALAVRGAPGFRAADCGLLGACCGFKGGSQELALFFPQERQGSCFLGDQKQGPRMLTDNSNTPHCPHILLTLACKARFLSPPSTVPTALGGTPWGLFFPFRREENESFQNWPEAIAHHPRGRASAPAWGGEQVEGGRKPKAELAGVDPPKLPPQHIHPQPALTWCVLVRRREYASKLIEFKSQLCCFLA